MAHTTVEAAAIEADDALPIRRASAPDAVTLADTLRASSLKTVSPPVAVMAAASARDTRKAIAPAGIIVDPNTRLTLRVTAPAALAAADSTRLVLRVIAADADTLADRARASTCTAVVVHAAVMLAASARA